VTAAPDLSTGRLPDLLLVGAARCGTTGLARRLGAQPEIFMSNPKELHFFDDKWDRGLAWYRSQFAGGAGTALAGEATTSYMYEEAAVARMADTLPRARVLAVLRNPVDRAWSHYWFNRAAGFERLPFGEALAQEPARLATGAGLRPADRPRRYAYVARGRYLSQLQRLARRYPAGQLLVLILEEDLADDAGGALARVRSFLGLDRAAAAVDPPERVNHPVRFRSRSLARLGSRLPRPLARAVSSVNSRPMRYPPLEPGPRRALEERFAEEIPGLARWLDRDLSCWS